ncbi:hypothetical protein [Rhodoferax sp.]|uniref:hypothetical protein n=1 Tax=Rhodoferax sp. TaxID=50421 RepID=UPI0027514D69|nr:hypothetical protein [Rhodoferax sp.]
MQFDFFNDSHSVACRNDVILALEQCDAAAARRAWQTLGQHYPQDECLSPLLRLIEAVAGRTQAPFRDHRALRDPRQALLHDITPVAHSALGASGAAVWLRARWRELAQRAEPLVYRAEHSEDHAAPLWLRGADWRAAEQAVARIESWRRIPAPLSWMLHARLALLGLQANWGLLAELAWLSPSRLDDVVKQTADPVLQPWVAKFDQIFDGLGDASDLAWFPAWLLTQRPSLAPQLAQAQASQHSPPEQALRLLVELLGLERQGRQREVIDHRKTLRGLHASLYAAYMATR